MQFVKSVTLVLAGLSIVSCKTRGYNAGGESNVEALINASEAQLIESIARNDNKVWTIVEEKAGGNAVLGWGYAMKNTKVWNAARKSVSFMTKLNDGERVAVSQFFINAGERAERAYLNVKSIPTAKYYKTAMRAGLRDAHVAYGETVAGLRNLGYSTEMAERFAQGVPFSTTARQVSDLEAYADAVKTNNKDGVMAAIYMNGSARSMVENDLKAMPEEIRASVKSQVSKNGSDINVAKEHGFLDPWSEKVKPEEVPGLVRSKRLPAFEGIEGEAGGAGEILADSTAREMKINKIGAYERALAKCSCAMREASVMMQKLSKVFGGLFNKETARVIKTEEIFNKGFVESGVFHKVLTASEGKFILDLPGRGKMFFTSAEELKLAINEVNNWNTLAATKLVAK